jgi:hypothetical protein
LINSIPQELEEKANAADAAAIRSQLNELTSLWSRVNKLTERKTHRLEEALKEAEQLHKAVHTLLEWLSDAEMKLRYVLSFYFLCIMYSILTSCILSLLGN